MKKFVKSEYLVYAVFMLLLTIVFFFIAVLSVRLIDNIGATIISSLFAFLLIKGWKDFKNEENEERG
jgi:positive regulator of sigma E activity